MWSALQSHQGYFHSDNPAVFLTDFLLNVIAILLATTLHSSNTILLNTLLVSSAVFVYVLPSASGKHKKAAKPLGVVRRNNAKAEEEDKLDDLPVRPFITAYRGGMMVVTCIAILAVDFRVFPRRFAKVETWGTSLMDMGVGSFVFSAGLVSARPVLQARLAGERSSLNSLLHSSLKSSVPLLLLGIVRCYSVKGLDYAEHVTEYGVHWNFFFTLAFLPPFAALYQTMSPGQYSTALLSLAHGVIYEAALSLTSLKAYMLTVPRTNLLSQNREGVFSFCGYLAIFLAGRALGFIVFPRYPQLALKNQRIRLLSGLIIASGGWSILFCFMTSYKYGLDVGVSRRLANFPYVLWVAAFNSAQITVYCVIETLAFPTVHLATNRISELRESDKASSRVIKAYNRNGLAIFLLSNLVTGLVNMTLDTLSIGHMGAMALLVGYAGFLTLVAVALDHCNVSLKL